jgi:PKD repeat protein
LLLPGENAVFYDRSEFDPAGHLWSFGAANPETSKSLRPTVIFPAIGNYDISLTVSNPKGNNTARKNAYIRVSNFRTVKNTGNDLRLPQDASGNITGTNTRNDRAKAEFYGAITPLNELLGVEVQFAQLQASDPNAELTFALYQGETPAAALVSKKVKVRDLLLQGNNVRVAFDAPQKPTGAFFLSVEWENNVQIGIFASTKTPGSAWEKTSGGTWQPLSKPTSEGGRGQNLALAIYPLVTPGDAPTAINDEHLASKISVFPNPTKGLISVRTEDIHLTNVSVYDPTGRLLIEKTVQGNDFSFDVSTFSQGIFLLKIETENGVAVKKVIVEK